MFEVTALCGQICLGKQGENLARLVYFDEPSAWRETFGEGRCELLHQRNGDEGPYPVLLEVENDKVCWKITASDTAIVGDGKCELRYYVDGVVVKSETWTTTTLPSLGEELAEVPEPYQNWVDEVLGAHEEVKLDTKKLELMDVNGSNISFTGDKNTVGVRKEIGTFECTAIDESTNKYTFAASDTSVFVASTEYKVTIDEVDYIVRTSKINTDNVVLVAVSAAVPFVVGNTYTIIFETANAVAFGKGNTVLAHNGFSTGYNNAIDETGGQGDVGGYGNTLKGKNSFIRGTRNESDGEGNFITGVSNKVKGNQKVALGLKLISKLTSNSSTVLGMYNIDTENALFILGNGTSENNRKNAIVVYKNGNVEIVGDLDIGGDLTVDGKTLATIEDILSHSGIDIGKAGTGTSSVILNSKNNVSSGRCTLTGGAANETTQDQGVTFGYDNYNGGKNSLAVGRYNYIKDKLENAIALGARVNVNGSESIGVGKRLEVDGKNQVALGLSNIPDTTSVLILGCGSVDGTTRKNAITVRKSDGYTTLYDGAEVKGGLTVGGGITSKGSMTASGNITATGMIKGSNLFPKSVNFVANGNVTDYYTGEVVAKHSNNGYVDFNIVEVSYGYDGVMIKNHRSLIVPIKPTTLKAGTYNRDIPCYGFRLDDCNFKAYLFDGYTENVIETMEQYVITKDIVIDKVYLKTEIADSDIPYNGTYRFHGEGILSFNVTMVTDITADLIGATPKIATELRLLSPNGTEWKVSIDNSGNLETSKVHH